MKKNLAVLLIAAQFILSFVFLLTPKPAQAIFGFGDLTIVLKDLPAALEKMVQGAMVSQAQNYANKYLTRFVAKMQDKYKIRDFLYYDRYLTNYNLSNLLLDNISDPDLRQAMDLMYRAKVSGETGGYTGVDPRVAIIPQLKKAISDYYLSQGGIDPDKIYNPPAGMTDREYFAMAKAYYANPRSFTEQNLQARFGEFQSEATTASQLEILVGQGSKAGRVLTGSCSQGSIIDPVSCRSAGGTWNRGALDRARDFIDNPTAEVNRYMTSAIDQIFKTNYDPQNIYTAIGASLGNYIFNQLNVDKPEGVFREMEYEDLVDDNEIDAMVGTDIDGDGVIDIYRTPGFPDVCVFGGPEEDDKKSLGPPCMGSGESLQFEKPEPCVLELTVENSVSSESEPGGSSEASGEAAGTVVLECPDSPLDLLDPDDLIIN